MHYINRNGVSEQIQFYRQQPREMQHVPFDFEEQDELHRKAMIDRVVFGVCAVGLVVLYSLAYVK